MLGCIGGRLRYTVLVVFRAIGSLAGTHYYLCGSFAESETDSFSLQSRATPAAFNAASNQLRAYASDSKATPTEVSSILEQRIRGVQEEASLAETGRVLSVGYAPHNAYL